MLRILKILTPISYLFIVISSTHFAAPLILMIFGGFFSGNALFFLFSLLQVTSIVLFFFSARRFNIKSDIYLFIFGGIVLYIPIIQQCIWLYNFENELFYEDKPFFIPSLIFLILLLVTIDTTINSKRVIESGQQ
jgi:hypothetical protein